MRGRTQARRPIDRLLAAVLFTVLAITFVHGAASAAVPAGAIAQAHASMGAALFPPAPSAGAGTDSESGTGRATTRQWTYEELRRPAVEQVQLGNPSVPPELEPAPPDLSRATPPGARLPERPVGAQPGRAPPAG
ncbi:hypothetical protein [Polymorphospora rubra]|uniref:Uncharacterized protein n=1 Tax=Polymorphospora rubra TaxID=338584 RepID=A0A810N609_9ACTN|nr:hypothetical protein [Polymorphospora rubra]BCJ67093.1 hypothetical protein Prubr_41140 [Polymorphospora rubra]